MPRKASSSAAKAKTKTKKAASATIQIQYYRSTISCPEKQKQIVLGLGFRKLNQIVERPDTASMRGAVAKIPHLIRIIE